MIKQKVYIDQHDWLVYCFFATRSSDAREILSLIDYVGIGEEQYGKAKRHLIKAEYNSGVTFSNLSKHTSVMVFSETTSAEQMVNTFAHELRHLADDIGMARGIPSSGEEIAYLTGDVAMVLAANLLEVVCNCPVCSHLQANSSKFRQF